ncbi:unnamed protein product [Cylindrotheca closterium]|uniref:Tudor-knot domain-containing protein n=1 Tax=Cylindrotheca closterium TaxID=2856 RepID=A0AAD2GB32_9STRA|nr:unnamed protein product [Cylindrotheca closterium]
MVTHRRRTRSDSVNANNASNETEEDESTPKDTDVLFGCYDFLENHPGTKQWASVVGTYSNQYYWSSTLYQRILNDKHLLGKRYFVFLKKNKFRPATELEIEQRTCGVFDNGGGKKKQSRKRRTPNGDKLTTGVTTTTANMKNSANDFQEGDNVYVYDQLWRGKIVEMADFVDGRKYKVHYTGFLATSDQWVDKLQLFPYSEQMKEIYNQIDKAEGTAFEGEYDVAETTHGNEDYEDAEEHELGVKKRRRAQTKGKRGSTASNNSKVANPKNATTHTQRSSSPSNTTSTTVATEESITDNEEVNSISASHYNNVTKLAGDGVSETFSHRLFTMKQKSKTTANSNSTPIKAAAKTATGAAASIDSNETTDSSHFITDALAKCEAAKRTAQEEGMTSIRPLLNGEAAKWSFASINRFLNVEEIQTNFLQLDQMKSDVVKWKEEGGIKWLEALAMERNIEKWSKAQEHLAKFVECLVEDL